MLPRVYKHASAPQTWTQQLWAAYLWAGEGAAVSHEAAAALWRLDGCPTDRITLITTRSVKAPNDVLTIRRVAQVPSHHLTRKGGVWVTTPTRTVINLAAVLSEDDLEAALDCALRRGSTSVPRLNMELQRKDGRGQPGRKALSSLLRERSPDYSPTHSVLETRFRRLLKRGALPLPGQQHIVRRQHQNLARVDFVYPEQGLVIEVDGYSSHGSRGAWQYDLTRQNDLVISGLKVLRYTWRDVCTNERLIVDTLQSFFSPSLPLHGSS